MSQNKKSSYLDDWVADAYSSSMAGGGGGDSGGGSGGRGGGGGGGGGELIRCFTNNLIPT